jgi:hypothetical protein
MDQGPHFTQTFLVTPPEISAECSPLKTWERTPMKRLAILPFILGVLATPVQAQTTKPVEFNGMVFDSPPAATSPAPTTTTKPRAAHHTKKHHSTHSSS